jgi:beta-N-acetylhexosaminidase
MLGGRKALSGHGFIAADSHTDLPRDARTLDALQADDLIPFAVLAAEGMEAVMPCACDLSGSGQRRGGFSKVWLQDILRGRLGFDGLIFSDDLEMAGAHAAGDIVARAEAAVAAGCDMVLACNDFAAMMICFRAGSLRRSRTLHAEPRAMEGR